jgi:hypothetical protein
MRYKKKNLFVLAVNSALGMGAWPTCSILRAQEGGVSERPSRPALPLNLPLGDRRYLQAAEGWLGLGDWKSANGELASITESVTAHPDVLKVRFRVYAAAQRWQLAFVVAEALVTARPDDSECWIYRAFALHEFKRRLKTWSPLPLADQIFPEMFLIIYDLACYAGQLGHISESRQWLSRAIVIGGADKVKLMSLDDPELAPLWQELLPAGNPRSLLPRDKSRHDVCLSQPRAAPVGR